MKLRLGIIYLVVLLIVGCSDHNSILEPTNEFSEGNLEKGRVILIERFDDDNKDNGDFTEDDDNPSSGARKFDEELNDREDFEDFGDLDKFKMKHSKNFTVNRSPTERLTSSIARK